MRARSSSAGSPPGPGAASVSGSASARDRLAQDRAQHRDHVGRLRHHGRALLDEVVAALRARIERRARHREDLAALLERAAAGDQRARALGGLDHHDAGCEAGNQPVAAGKIASAGFPADPQP
jgi:hypothetical protein